MDTSRISKISQFLIENTKAATNVDTALLGENEVPVLEPSQPSSIMENALTSDFYSKQELDAKKVMSAALLIAKKKGVLPETLKDSIDMISSATLADETVSRMKVSYRIASGLINAYKGVDKLIDQATARMIAVSDTVVEKGVDYALNSLETAVAICYPPAKPIVAVIRIFQPYITTTAQIFVKKGIAKLNKIAKESIHKVKEFVKIKASNKIRSLLCIQ